MSDQPQGRAPGAKPIAVVLEADAAEARRIGRVLDGAGIRVLAAATADAALAALSTSRAELLIVDDNAHGLGALALIGLARPLLAAADTAAIVIGRRVEEGVAGVAFLERPFQDDDLREAIEAARWMREHRPTTEVPLPAGETEQHTRPTIEHTQQAAGASSGRTPSAGVAPWVDGGHDADASAEAPRKRFKSTLSFSPNQVPTMSTADALGMGDVVPQPAPPHPAVRRAERSDADPTARQQPVDGHPPAPASSSPPPSAPGARRAPSESHPAGRPTTAAPSRGGADRGDDQARKTASMVPVMAPARPSKERVRPLRSTLLPEEFVIAERYELRGVLGTGGMAVVYRAHDRELDEDIALKLLKDDRADEQSLTRFRHELRICRRLQHPAIVQTYEFGVWEGRRFLTMELLDGDDLARLLTKRRAPLGVLEAVELFVQAARGLDAAHRAGVIHRDIKPHNMFVLAGGNRLKIMDFGIAKSDALSTTMTNAEHVLGTPAYLAPERLRDQVELSALTDLYSLGVTMYQMLTGKLPFSGPDVSTLLTAILLDVPAPARAVRSEIPAPLDALITRMITRDPAERPTHCGQVADELEAIAASLRRAWA